ncbi:MAG: hypothetical protein K0R93_2790 [Anaerosolibacter sp.]|nr:hypothetical protein [Anaerosolibacter sp.]
MSIVITVYIYTNRKINKNWHMIIMPILCANDLVFQLNQILSGQNE